MTSREKFIYQQDSIDYCAKKVQKSIPGILVAATAMIKMVKC